MLLLAGLGISSTQAAEPFSGSGADWLRMKALAFQAADRLSLAPADGGFSLDGQLVHRVFGCREEIEDFDHPELRRILFPKRVVIDPKTRRSNADQILTDLDRQLVREWQESICRQSRNVIGIQGEDDSALYTGIHLGAQCLHYKNLLQAEADGGLEARERKAQVRERLLGTLGAVDRLFAVTATPGLMARFVYDPGNTGKLKVIGYVPGKPAFPKVVEGGVSGPVGESSDMDLAVREEVRRYWDAGWRVGKGSGPELWFLGDTSRDQYAGMMFGLGVCSMEAVDADIRERARDHFLAVVRALDGNGWHIPNGFGFAQGANFHTVAGNLKLSWLQLASRLDPGAWKAAYDREMKDGRGGITGRWNEQTQFNNLFEYYAWNHRYLAYWTLLRYEQDPARLEAHRNLFRQKMWAFTRAHDNSQFTFTAMLDPVIRKKEDPAIARKAVETVYLLLQKDRRNWNVDLSRDPRFPRERKRRDLQWTSEFLGRIFNLPKLRDFARHKMGPVSAVPVPILERPEADYFWQVSPGRLVQTGAGSVEHYPLDAYLAYWMGVESGDIAWR